MPKVTEIPGKTAKITLHALVIFHENSCIK